MKRISFDKYDAIHLYELALEHFQKNCYECDKIKARLKKFIDDEADLIEMLVKENGYCKK